MQNDRAIEDENLQAGLDEIKEIMLRRGLAGAAMLVSADEAAFTYGLHAPWSALTPDPRTPLGFRFRAKTAEDGKEATERKVSGAMHTICQICDFGYQTAGWMDDLKEMLRKAGIDFVHRPFGGKPLPRLGSFNGR
jgi:hypothetical protein